MIDQETIKQIQQASPAERIQLIELILKSLKQDMSAELSGEKPGVKMFKVRQFNLGQEIQVNRDEIYAVRGI